MEISKKLNILFWRAEYYGGYTNLGVASLYMGLVNASLQLGWKPRFISSGLMDLPNEVPFNLLRHNKLLSNLPEILNLPYNFKSTKFVLNNISNNETDIIFQHNHDFNFGAALIKERTGKTVFIHCDGVEYWIKKNWGTLYLGKLLEWAERIQWEKADKLFVVSTRIKELITSLGVDSNKIIVSPNGVNTDFFREKIINHNLRKELGIKPDDFVCSFAGSFGPWHGVDTIAESMKHIKKMSSNIKFLLIGDGELRPILENIIKRDGSEDVVIFTGVIDYKLLPDYLSLADVLLTPCKSNDDDTGFFNSPIKLFEYMAMNKPIIATNVGQQKEIMKYGELGTLIDERQPEILAEAIFEIYKNPGKYKEMATLARNNVVENFDWKNNIKRIFDAYEEVNP